jgi:hypothetical protein
VVLDDLKMPLYLRLTIPMRVTIAEVHVVVDGRTLLSILAV